MPDGTKSTIFTSKDSSGYVWGQQGGKFGRWPASLFSGSSAPVSVSNPAFLDLTDVDPTSYSGQAGKFVAVNAGGTGLEFSAATLSGVAATFGVGGATPAASGAGITFPATQSASTDANTLDDYEEGTWTPVMTSVSGTITNGAASGNYTKIGNTVFFRLQINTTATSGASGQVKISLPFISANSGGATGCSIAIEQFSTYRATAFINPSVDYVSFYRVGTITALTGAEVPNSSCYWAVSGCYIV